MQSELSHHCMLCFVLQQGRQQQFLWRAGAEIIESVRKDIYVFSTGRIVNLPEARLKKTVLQLCRDIISGVKPILPDGFHPSNLEERAIHEADKGTGHRNRYENDPYLRQMKVRGVSTMHVGRHSVSGRSIDQNYQLITCNDFLLSYDRARLLYC
jgi:hypothetical protein